MYVTIVIITIVCILILLFICILLQKSPIAYYPVIELQSVNNTISRAEIQTSSSYPIPFGFTFLTNWTFHSTKIGGSDITLTNTIATVTNNDYSIIMGTKELTGKVMYSVEMKYPGNQYNINVNINGFGIVSGLLSPEYIYNYNKHIGSNTQGIVVYDTGHVWFNNVQDSVSGDVFKNQNSSNIVDIAVDTMAKLFWYRVDGGNWNGGSDNNPATGQGGWSIHKITN